MNKDFFGAIGYILAFIAVALHNEYVVAYYIFSIIASFSFLGFNIAVQSNVAIFLSIINCILQVYSYIHWLRKNKIKSS